MNSFEYILAIAEERHLTHAAEKLFITQPALTLRLNRLEKELGIKLFDRSKTPIEITREGEVYIAEMQKIEAQRERLLRTLHSMSQEQPEHITLGIGLNRGKSILPMLLPYLKKHEPSLTVQICEAADGDMEQLIKKGTVDAGILGSAVMSSELFAETITREKLLLAVPAQHPILSELDTTGNTPQNPCVLQPERLNGQTFIMGNDSFGLTRYINLLFSLYHIKPGYILNISNSETAYLLAAAGEGITLTLAEIAAVPFQQTFPSPVFCVLPNFVLERNVLFACRSARKAEPVLQRVGEHLKKLYSRVPD